MPSVRAASSALPRSREAIAVTSLHTPFSMPGMIFVTAIFAVLRIPQRTLDIARHHSRKGRGGKTCATRSRLRGSQPRLPRTPFLDSVGPLVVLESNESDIVKIFTGSEIVAFNRHDGLLISYRVMGRATKRILKAVQG